MAEKLYTTNTTSSSFTRPTPTTAAPAGNGVIEMTTSWLSLTVFGQGSLDDDPEIEIFRYLKSGGLWYPVPLIHIRAVLGNAVGISGEDVTDSDRFAYDYEVQSGAVRVNQHHQPATVDQDVISWIEVEVGRSNYIYADMKVEAATNCNALFDWGRLTKIDGL